MKSHTVKEIQVVYFPVVKFTRYLLIIVAVLIVLNIVGQYMTYVLNANETFGFVKLFHMDRESNIPTFFSSTILLFSALLLSLVYFVKKKNHDLDRNYWLLLSIIFLGLAIDETISFHEKLIWPIRQLVGINEWYYYAWIIPAGILLIVLGLALYKFVLRLPADTRLQFIIAGLLYVGGALGVEIIGGYYHFFNGQNDLYYNLITTVEETMEMIGIILFIRAILRYVSHHLNDITISVEN